MGGAQGRDAGVPRSAWLCRRFDGRRRYDHRRRREPTGARLALLDRPRRRPAVRAQGGQATFHPRANGLVAARPRRDADRRRPGRKPDGLPPPARGDRGTRRDGEGAAHTAAVCSGDGGDARAGSLEGLAHEQLLSFASAESLSKVGYLMLAVRLTAGRRVAIRGRRAERSKAAAWRDSNAPRAPQFFFSTSLWTVLPISIKRRQTFSRNEITLSTSASLGSLSSGSPGFAPDGPETPGTGSPRAKSSFFRLVFSPCRRAISVSSAERSSGTTLQAQPISLRLHCETWPVRVSSRSTPSARIEAVAAVSLSGVAVCADATAKSASDSVRARASRRMTSFPKAWRIPSLLCGIAEVLVNCDGSASTSQCPLWSVLRTQVGHLGTPRSAMCGRLRVGKGNLHVCGQCSHVFGLARWACHGCPWLF